MKFVRRFSATEIAFVILVGVSALAAQMQSSMPMSHTSTQFAGPKANTGTVTHSRAGGKNILTLSDDFQVPDTPDPHWQLVDSQGKTYLLDRVAVKGGRVVKSITVPTYVPDVAKVQIWCAFAETVLGEASFSKPVM